jgi:hypothetical protein
MSITFASLPANLEIFKVVADHVSIKPNIMALQDKKIERRSH